MQLPCRIGSEMCWIAGRGVGPVSVLLATALLVLLAGAGTAGSVRHHYRSTSLTSATAGHRSSAVGSRESAGYMQNDAGLEGEPQQTVVEQLLEDEDNDDILETKRKKPGISDVTETADIAMTTATTVTTTTSAKTQTGQSTYDTTSRSRMPYGLSKGLMEIRKANEHYLKVHTEARCKTPRPRVIRVKEFYPDPSKDYLPSCTVLHKCGEETGCCESESMQCVAKRQAIVELHFYKLHLSGQQGGGVGLSGTDTVERLSFVNDTECECQQTDERPRFHARKTACLQCPSGFTLREHHVQHTQQAACACDCFDKQKSCLKMKRGREALSEIDRRCVEARRCHQPDCEYGVYDASLGRCPRKSDRRHGGQHATGHQWWRFDERD